MELLSTGSIYPLEEAEFTSFEIRKSDGTLREIWAPNEAMRDVHAHFMWQLSAIRHQLSPAATGSLEGCSPVKNVEPHAGNRYFYQLDFKDAYSQVEVEALARILASLEYEATEQDIVDTVQLFKRYCFLPERPQTDYDIEYIGQGVLFGEELQPELIDLDGPKGLVTGAPTSPFLFNVYCVPLDEALLYYCEKRGIVYTRYLDDLTFSSSDSNGTINKNDRRIIRSIIEHHNFELNHKKTRVSDVTKAPVIITGLQLNKYGNWQITERYLRAAYRRLYELATTLGIHDFQTIELAAGYKGLLVASADSKRSKPAPTELRLLVLVNAILPERSDEFADWYNPDFA